MREIKFRAWFGRPYYSEPHMAYLDINDDFGGASAIWQLRYLQHPKPDGPIYMQYTGLKDKNGVEIYEGDIVDDHYFKNHVSRHKVYWADSYGCWSTINLKDPIVDRKQLGYFNEAKDLHRNEYLEVIGNIYENPELLEANL